VLTKLDLMDRGTNALDVRILLMYSALISLKFKSLAGSKRCFSIHLTYKMQDGALLKYVSHLILEDILCLVSIM
jgi:hypothetical protein